MKDIFYFTPRPIGIGWGPCFVCGTESQRAVPEISLMVGSKDDGERIVEMFQQGARLDYRDWEPHWIQVKITACETHRQELEILIEDAKVYRFSEEQVGEHYDAYRRRNQKIHGSRSGTPE